ncbi:MAG: hypothetical protein J6S29_04275 [Methanosphaera sp.]|nr:hypothetical protein [Methanosphaera sp.]
MDSRKFKKVTVHKKDKRKKKITYNKKYIVYLIMTLIIITVFTGLIGGIIFRVPEDSQLIKPQVFDFHPYGYEFNKDLYGYCNATDEYGNTRTYYFTLEQMAALYQSSGGTFNFTDGIYVSLDNTTSSYNVVDNIYKKNGAKIIKPQDYNEYEFAENARFLGRNNTYCARGFGFSNDEYNDSVF